MLGRSIPYFLALWQEDKKGSPPRSFLYDLSGTGPTGRRPGSFAIFAGSAYRYDTLTAPAACACYALMPELAQRQPRKSTRTPGPTQ